MEQRKVFYFVLKNFNAPIVLCIALFCFLLFLFEFLVSQPFAVFIPIKEHMVLAGQLDIDSPLVFLKYLLEDFVYLECRNILVRLDQSICHVLHLSIRGVNVIAYYIDPVLRGL